MPLTTGLPVSRYVSVQVLLTTQAVVAPAINTLLIVGSSEVIDPGERARTYGSIAELAADFGTDAVEYHAADMWFSQNPRPDNVMVGRWAQVPTPAGLIGGILTAAEQDMALWNAVASGNFIATIGGADQTVAGLSFPATTHFNLNAVAATISTAIAPNTCVWTGSNFLFRTAATGVAASMGFLRPVTPPAGTDLSVMLKGASGTGARPYNGTAAETALSAVVHIDALFSSGFYGVVVPEADDDEQMDIASYVEASDPPHYLGVTVTDPEAMDPLSITDLASRLMQFGYNKTAAQYSTTNHYAICSYLGRILTTNWTGMNTAITLMYKRQPGVGIEFLSTTHANALQNKHCNVYTGVANGAHITQYGTSASGEYTDTIIGADAFALNIQNALFNALYDTPTKIPQTDFGVGILKNTANRTCSQFALNGWIGPGTWDAPGFGELVQGELLQLGYYVWSPSVALQDVADRAARRSPVIMIAAKCAGAVHLANVVIFVNQ